MPETKVKASGIDHVVLHVSDLKRSRRFYLDVLGMTVAHESSGQTFLSCGAQLVALFEVGDATPVRAGAELNHLALRVASASYEEVKAHLEGRGIEVTGRPGHDRCIYFNDPDGHRLQLVVPGEH